MERQAVAAAIKTYTASEVAKSLGLPAVAFNAILVDAGVQYRTELGHYALCERYQRYESELTDLNSRTPVEVSSWRCVGFTLASVDRTRGEMAGL